MKQFLPVPTLVLCLLASLPTQVLGGSTFCGNCIDNGYRYCNAQGREENTDFRAITSESIKSSNTAKCCSDDSATCYEDKMRLDNGKHTICSFPYNNTLYAKFQCPFDNSCGSTYEFNLDTIGQSTTFDIKPPAYSSCFFIFKSTCGIVSIDSSGLSSYHKYEFIEFEEDHLYTGPFSA
jgi:hypothetical protein